MAVLDDLRRSLRGAKATLLWDGLTSHRSRRMANFIARQRSWLVVQRLPAYAPRAHPVEGLWSSLKGRELANRCDDTIAEVVEAADAGIQPIRSSQHLLFAFLDKTGLSF